MDIVEFRTLVSEIRVDSNKSPKNIVENEKKIYEAAMNLTIDGEDGEEIICEMLNLLLDFPAVLQLLHLMAREPQHSNQSPDFSTAHTLFANTESQ